MKISSKKIIGMMVETKSGENLGKVESFNLEVESQSVLEYKIKPSSLVTGLIKEDLIISRGQVIEITNKKMIVDDNVVKNKTENELKKIVKQRAVQGALMKTKQNS